MEKELYVLEGSQCLQLEAQLGPMDDHRLWICKYLVEGPNEAKKMHKEFLEAGTDILESLSYQISVEELMKIYGVSVDKAVEIIQSSVSLARAAWSEHAETHGSNKKHIVGGAVGSYGALQHDGSEYTGAYIDKVTPELLTDWHRPRVKALVDAGVDFLCFETLPSVVEALALIRLLREFPNQKAWISFTCKEGLKNARGELFGESVAECWRHGRDQILALGCNCTQPGLVTDLLKSVNDAVGEPVPIVIYPNSGEVFDIIQNQWTGEPLNLGLFAPEWLSLGVKYIGGCCRSRICDIRSIREVVDAHLPTK